MTEKDIARLRLYNQHVSHQKFKTPAEIVGYLGAVQAQDYAGAKWA
ncbi:MAG: winged helix DNA-binding domain-containing protein, partial [Sphingobacteriales bacterium]